MNHVKITFQFGGVSQKILRGFVMEVLPGIFIKSKKYLNESIIQPNDLFTKDHLLIILQEK